MSNLWSGRFDSEPNAAVFDFGASFRFDRRLFEDDVIGSLAWAEALKSAGALSASDAAAIGAALRDILAKGQADPTWVSGSDEDVHSFVERQLVERIGDAGRRLHTGRSRNEQVSLDLRLFLRRRIVLSRAGSPTVDCRVRIAGGTLSGRSHAGIHAPAAGAAGAHRALPSRTRGGASPGSRALRHRGRGSRRTATGLGRCRRRRITPSTRHRWRARSASRAWSSTALTPPPIATSFRRSFTRAPSRWCT